MPRSSAPWSSPPPIFCDLRTNQATGKTRGPGASWVKTRKRFRPRVRGYRRPTWPRWPMTRWFRKVEAMLRLPLYRAGEVHAMPLPRFHPRTLMIAVVLCLFIMATWFEGELTRHYPRNPRNGWWISWLHVYYQLNNHRDLAGGPFWRSPSFLAPRYAGPVIRPADLFGEVPCQAEQGGPGIAGRTVETLPDTARQQEKPRGVHRIGRSPGPGRGRSRRRFRAPPDDRLARSGRAAGPGRERGGQRLLSDRGGGRRRAVRRAGGPGNVAAHKPGRLKDLPGSLREPGAARSGSATAWAVTSFRATSDTTAALRRAAGRTATGSSSPSRSTRPGPPCSSPRARSPSTA